MIIKAWNVNGLHKPIRQSAVQKMFKESKIDLACFVETKFTVKALDLFMKYYMPLHKYDSNLDLCKGGRIVTIWNPETVSVTKLHATKQAIHYNIRCKTSNCSFLFTAIYGYWNKISRKPLWESFYHNSLNWTEPWLIAGDFNVILKPDERHSKKTVRASDVEDFNNFCNDLGFVDTSSHGVHFTWNNKKGDQRSKIDRVMVNDAWRENDWICHTEFMPRAFFSDHSASLTTCFSKTVSKPKPFKFHNMWTSHPKYIETVEEAWRVEISGNKQYILAKKLQVLKSGLRILNKQEFSGIGERANDARRELEELERAVDADPSNEDLRAKVADCKDRTSKLSEAEFQFWK